jgi:hypothetical protein
VLRTREVVLGEHVLVIVRHDGLLRPSGANLLAADDDGDLDLLGRHRLQPRFELCAFGGAGRV